MLKGIGIDIESTHRIGKLLASYENTALQLIFTKDELERCHHAEIPAQYLTICFSAKEAIGKALGTGLATINWIDIEADVQGDQVVLTLYRTALRRVVELRASWWQAKWSCWNDHIVVTVVVQ